MVMRFQLLKKPTTRGETYEEVVASPYDLPRSYWIRLTSATILTGLLIERGLKSKYCPKNLKLPKEAQAPVSL